MTAPHVVDLLRTFGWATIHEVRHGRPGWRSNAVPPENPPSAWATAMVLSFCRGLQLLLDRMGRDVVLREFGASWPARLEQAGAADRESWSPRADSSTRLSASGPDVSLKALIFDHFVLPRQVNGDADKAAWAGIMFGPPGTAKTSLAEELAGALGWPLVTLSSSDFLALGMDRMAHQARLLFRRLGELSSTVVLIDEVEEFVRTRSGSTTPTEIANRLITTAMLTLLQELRNRERVILLLATNHVKQFDPAITRPGRFDLILNIAPPSPSAKAELLERSIGGPLTDEIKHVLAGHADVVERATYSEWKQVTRWAKTNTAFTPKELGDQLEALDDRLTITPDDWKSWQVQPSQVNIA